MKPRQRLQLLTFALWCVGTLHSIAQSQVNGQAQLAFEDLGYLCAEAGHGVTLHADLTGLAGNGGLAGLNAFVLDLTWDDGQLLAVKPGAEVATWQFTTTALAQANQQRRLRVVGSLADSQAPNRDYRLATLVFANQPTSLTLTLDGAGSSLASRSVGGFGPDAIALAAPQPIVLNQQAPACSQSNDPNGDGVVDEVDVALFIEMFQQGTGTLAQDCNGDNQFSVADILCLFQQVHPLDHAGYAPTSLLDCDASGGSGNLFTDGVMLALFVAGVRDPQTLTQNLINQSGAGRSDPQTILAYLELTGTLLDIDGNGQVDLFTDVAMIWLHMAGVRGAALVDGLLGVGASRNDATSIEAYLASLSQSGVSP